MLQHYVERDRHRFRSLQNKTEILNGSKLVIAPVGSMPKCEQVQDILRTERPESSFKINMERLVFAGSSRPLAYVGPIIIIISMTSSWFKTVLQIFSSFTLSIVSKPEGMSTPKIVYSSWHLSILHTFHRCAPTILLIGLKPACDGDKVDLFIEAHKKMWCCSVYFLRMKVKRWVSI